MSWRVSLPLPPGVARARRRLNACPPRHAANERVAFAPDSRAVFAVPSHIEAGCVRFFAAA
jgi:hypothetical protein